MTTRDTETTDKRRADPQDRVQALVNLLRLIDTEYELVSDWIGNGCEHGFKPAKNCPNADCTNAKMHRLWDEILGG